MIFMIHFPHTVPVFGLEGTCDLYGYNGVCFAHTLSPSLVASTLDDFLRPKRPPKNPDPPAVTSCGSVSRRTDTPKEEMSVTPT